MAPRPELALCGPEVDGTGPEAGTVVGPTILLVEDDADCRESLAELFADDGYTVVTAKNGQEARAYLEKNPPPACIVTDLWMPEVDGWTLAAEVADGRLPWAPIVVVTAAPAYFGHPVPSRQVLKKPVDPGRLLRLVRSLATMARTGAPKIDTA